MITLEEFETYNMADELSDVVWNIVSKWDGFGKDTIGKQLMRSADSISANLAEGHGRFFDKENKQFCFYSRGSLLETKNWINKATRRSLIPPKDSEELIFKLEIIHQKLNAYIKSIGNVKPTSKE